MKLKIIHCFFINNKMVAEQVHKLNNSCHKSTMLFLNGRIFNARQTLISIHSLVLVNTKIDLVCLEKIFFTPVCTYIILLPFGSLLQFILPLSGVLHQVVSHSSKVDRIRISATGRMPDDVASLQTMALLYLHPGNPMVVISSTRQCPFLAYILAQWMHLQCFTVRKKVYALLVIESYLYLIFIIQLVKLYIKKD